MLQKCDILIGRNTFRPIIGQFKEKMLKRRQHQSPDEASKKDKPRKS
jgi:hypothetical protein